VFTEPIPNLTDDQRSKVEALLDDAASVLLAVEELDQRGMWIRTVASDGYPERLRSRLGSQAPTVVFGAGNADLLGAGGVGLVGSRDVSDEGAEAARAIAREAVRLGYGVVSGAARGVDQLSMAAAYEAGGALVGVLADALAVRIRRRDVLEALDAGTTCLISHQHPKAGFSAASAMGRNKIIYGLADVTVVVASDEGSGGTWAGATEALSRRYGPVAVWTGPGRGPGNEAIIRRGATPLSDPSGLVGCLQGNVPQGDQLSLLD
jgi:predicted Rossmann fold nucleotide-binding protein DprA/Smf involved in DNA uptake